MGAWLIIGASTLLESRLRISGGVSDTFHVHLHIFLEAWIGWIAVCSTSIYGKRLSPLFCNFFHTFIHFECSLY